MTQKIITAIVIFTVLIGFGMLILNQKDKCENTCAGTCYSNCSDELNFVCINDEVKCSYLSKNDTIKYYNKNIIEEKLDKIYITKDIVNLLNIDYNKTENEIYYCISGDIYKDSYIINDAYVPPMKSISEHSIDPLYGCIGNVFGYIHSHPNGICMPSNSTNNFLNDTEGGDIIRWIEENRSLYGIMCDVDKFVFYNKNEYRYDQYIPIIMVDNNSETDISIISDNQLCRNTEYYCNGDCFNMNVTISYECINNRLECKRMCAEMCYSPCTKGVFECVNGVGKCKI